MFQEQANGINMEGINGTGDTISKACCRREKLGLINKFSDFIICCNSQQCIKQYFFN